MSTSVTTRAARASAAPSTASGVPRKVMTERWWSGWAWTFASVTPGTTRIAAATVRMRARSRPSLTFGTRSTTGEAGPAAAAPGMRCILLGAMQFLPIGKLRAETLQAIFDKHPLRDPRVVVGPRVGEDAAVIDAGDRYLVATTDPITFATDEIGWYALQVNSNDIAVRGARPRWFLATLLLPSETTTEASVASLFAELHAACDELDVALVGGHTEITHGLDRPIVVGAMLGEVAKDKLVTTGGARVGDAVVLTKGVPLEGAAIIARAKEAELRCRGVPAPLIQRAKAFLRAPGLSVLPEVEIACELAEVHAMHDPTEGGIATALVELADAAGVGLRIDRDRIMVLPEGRTLCEAFGLDPLGTIASGALLMTLAPADAAVAVNGVLAVTQPNLCGLGGDLFCLYYEAATRRVHFLNGSGRSGSRASVDELARRGLPRLPVIGPPTVSVPGCVRAWAMLLERFGTRPLGELLGTAINAADGFPISALVSQAIREYTSVTPDAEWQRVFTRDGRAPALGELFTQPELARTLRALAAEGPDLFYTGSVGQAIARRLERDGFLTAADLAAHTGEWGEPISTTYRGVRVFETPPPTQGLAVLLASPCVG